MIVSHRHRFIFIKTLKTAGTSIEVYLSDHCGPEDVLTPVLPPEPGHRPRNHTGLFDPLFAWRHAGRNAIPSLRGTAGQLRRRARFYNHMPAVLVRDRVPRRVWRDYFKFCVEREPFGKTRSVYRMLRERGRVEDDGRPLREGAPAHDWDRYSDLDGRPMMDRILRYERLDAELAEVFGELGIPFPGTLRTRAKTAPAEAPREAVEFTEAQSAAIEQAFARELARWGRPDAGA